MLFVYNKVEFWDTVNSWVCFGKYLQDVVKLRGGDCYYTVAEFLVEDKLEKLVLEENI